VPRPEPQGYHNARSNYDRYMALAQAELQAGDRIAAEKLLPACRTLFQNVLGSRSDIADGGRVRRVGPTSTYVPAVDPNIRVSAKTVGVLRKVEAWPENLVVTTPEERRPGSAVKVSKASVATRVSPKP
jgi:hypothetical protein